MSNDQIQRFTPITITAENHEELIQILNEYFREIQEEILNPFGTFEFDKQTEAPAKVRDGLTVYADGTDWDPGSGEGIYSYYNSTWNKLG